MIYDIIVYKMVFTVFLRYLRFVEGTPYNFDRVEIPRISLRQAVVHKHSAVRHDDPSAFQH